jgi:rSAM/selenodomain-associated transferase 2
MISAIIPTLNEASIIESSLQNLFCRDGDLELIVADGLSADGTQDIVKRCGRAKLVSSDRGRGKQMNKGASVARGDILLFLHSDTTLPTGGLKSVREAMADTSVMGGAFCLSFDERHFLLRLYSLFSRMNYILFTYGDQGLFVRHDTFIEIGGFKDTPIMEDVEIQRRLRKAGRFVKIRSPVVTSARRFRKNGIIKQQLMNSLLVLLYHAGTSCKKLKPFYNDSTELSR